MDPVATKPDPVTVKFDRVRTILDQVVEPTGNR